MNNNQAQMTINKSENNLLNNFGKSLYQNSGTSFLDTIFGKHLLEVTSKKSSVVLFGVGAVGKELCQVLQLHGINPICFCDNNPLQINTIYCGIPVISFEELKKNYFDSLIIVASAKYDSEIKSQLLNNGFDSSKVLSISSIKHPELLGYFHYCKYYTNYPQPAIQPEELKKSEEQIIRAYNLLSDQRSKDIYTARLSVLIKELDYTSFSNYVSKYSELNETQRDSFPFYVSPEDYGYFNNDVLDISEGEKFLDGGAYNGLSALTFAETCKRKNLSYDKIYCFEPGEQNFELLKKSTEKLSNTTCIRYGLWSEKTNLVLLTGDESDPCAIIEECNNGKTVDQNTRRISIETTSIDEQFLEDDISFIKLDIEGAEVEAINGAANTIKRCKPKLAISAYHKISDIYELPLLINNIYPGYSFYLRQFGYTLFDMVLFAVPPGKK